MKEESEKGGFQFNIQKTKIMASGPITSWQIDGEIMGTLTDFIFLGSKIMWTVTVAVKLKDVCSLDEMTNLDIILKSRDITLPTKVHIVKAIVFQMSCSDVRVRP